MIASCLCPTHNRPRLLEEAIESFLRQILPAGVEAELVVLNDAIGQRFKCNAPGVRVVNALPRFGSLGEKFNALVELARGDILLPWEDDDISLPRRVAQALKALHNRDYFNPSGSWFLDGSGLHSDHKHGVCHNASAFTRRAWAVVKGYPHVSGNQDAVMDGKLKAVFGQNTPVTGPGKWQYIYRWGVSPDHLSGKAPHDAHYAEIGRQEVQRGEVLLKPHWNRDYQEDCHVHLRTA